MDPHKVLTKYLSENSHLKKKEIEIISSHFQAEHFKKEEPIVIEGKLYQKVLFISDGIARVFVHDSNGDEVGFHHRRPVRWRAMERGGNFLAGESLACEILPTVLGRFFSKQAASSTACGLFV